jgi:hypothetical protein
MVVGAKTYLLGLARNQAIDIWAQSTEWYDVQSELFDSDLYLQHLESLGLPDGVKSALRMSLECFRRQLYVPCIAMLGAAAEAVWIETGRALARQLGAQNPLAGRLEACLTDPRTSTKEKVSKVCDFYDRNEYAELRRASGIDQKRLRAIQQWSDQVRESRNVLHWGAEPSVPNTYEKVAVLLMDAVAELRDLRLAANVSNPPNLAP